MKLSTHISLGLITIGLCLGAIAAGAAEPATNVYVGPITNNATLNWLWATQYSFTVVSPLNGSVTGSSNDWYDAGTDINVEATPDTHYKFLQWENVPGGTSTNNPMSFTLSAPYTNVTALFTLKQYTITVRSDYGTLQPGSTNVTAFGYSQQSISPEKEDLAPGVRVRLKGYEVQGAAASPNAP